MNKHTPGPWYYPGTGCFVGGPDKVRVADTYLVERDPETHHANARMIAAAPDLLAALEWCAEWIDATAEPSDTGDGQQADAVLSAARAAIAKARGES